MPAFTAAQQEHLHEQGFLLIENAIQGDALHRLQTAFDHWLPQFKKEWLKQIATGDTCPTWFDIPDPLFKDEIFVDLTDRPPYFELIDHCYNGRSCFAGMSARAVPPWPLSYTGWHPDQPSGDALHLKVQVYVDDVPAQCGEFGYVPGSHKIDQDTYYRSIRNDLMPDHVTFPGKAGTAILFNSCGLHTAMDNNTRQPRKSVIMGYYPRPPGAAASSKYADLAHLCTTPQRRGLFELEAA